MDVVGDGNTARIKYTGTWAVNNVTGADGGTVHSTTDPGSRISLEFTGTSVQIDALKSPNGANYTVLLDGTTYGPYSLYSATTSVGNVWSQSQLNPTATHTITLQKVLVSSGPDSIFALNVDAFRIAAAVSSSSSASSTTLPAPTTSSSPSTTSTSSLRSEPTSSSISLLSTPSPSSSIPDPPPTDPGPFPTNERPATTSSTPIDRSQPTSDTPPPENDSTSDPTPDSTPDSNSDSSPNNIYTDDVADPSIEPASPTSTQSSTSRSSSRSQNSTSTSHTSSHDSTTLTFLAGGHSASAPASAASVSESASSTSGDNRVGVILGTVVAIIIFVCLITIPIIYIKRKREQNRAHELKASTTPAYQTRSAKGLLMPLGVYRRSTISPASPRSPNRRISHHWGFGSNSASARGQSASPNTTSPSPVRGGRPTSFEDREGRSHYLLYPDAAPVPAPLEYGRQRTDSFSSDYPYPLTYHTPQ